MGGGRYDVVVVGSGHNGLVAATLLARAGRSVCVLEAAEWLGGATTGAFLFDGVAARLSRYSYLVSLFPDELVAGLGLGLRLVSRPVASYTPAVRGGRPVGLLVERRPGPATEESFRELTGSDREWAAWQEFYRRVAVFARVIAPTMLGSLPRRRDLRDAVTRSRDSRLWDDLVERPIGLAIEDAFDDDLVRGVVATDAQIGIHASLHDEGLLANRCFAYHVIGNGTGEWRVPVGGMGAVADALVGAANSAGARLLTGAEASAIDESETEAEVRTAGGEVFGARWVLAACSPSVLDRLLGRQPRPAQGSQLKVNMVLRRLPALRSGLDPRLAFAGTLHLEQGYRQLLRAFATADAGALPDPLPVEVYCHSLTDPSILGAELAEAGYQTLTLFGLHAPAGLFATAGTTASAVGASASPAGDGAPPSALAGAGAALGSTMVGAGAALGSALAGAGAALRPGSVSADTALRSALASVQAHLAEPLDGLLATDARGQPCIEVVTPAGLERSLRMPGGHIFHADLDWPWLADDEPAETPAQRWGVAVNGRRRVLLAGAGSRRGGGVSGFGGLHAARAVLAAEARPPPKVWRRDSPLPRPGSPPPRAPGSEDTRPKCPALDARPPEARLRGRAPPSARLWTRAPGGLTPWTRAPKARL
jgi:phytoene dehydrogenase-like protein